MFKNLFGKSKASTPSGVDAIKAKYADRVKDLKGTDAEIAEQKKVLDELMAEEIAALDAMPEEEPKVTVMFTAPAFRHDGVEYKSKDVEAAAAEGDEDALKLINHLLDIKSGVITQVTE